MKNLASTSAASALLGMGCYYCFTQARYAGRFSHTKKRAEPAE